jgi:hypothetical protein
MAGQSFAYLFWDVPRFVSFMSRTAFIFLRENILSDNIHQQMIFSKSIDNNLVDGFDKLFRSHG